MPDFNFRATILFLTLIALYLFLQLFRLPLIPILFEGDHAVHLSNAWRMLRGEAAYRDFFLVTFPGTELFYLLLFKLFGVKTYLVNATFFGLLLGLAALGLYFSRKILDGLAVYLPISIFIIIGFRTLGTHASHRYFSVLAVMSAFAIVFAKRTSQRLILAGFFCGIASCFTQPRGLVGIAAIVSFIFIEKFYTKQSAAHLFRSFVCLVLPFALIIALTTIYFIFSAGYEAFYFATFVFPVQNYPADIWNNPQSYFRDIPSIYSMSLIGYLRLNAPALFFYFLIPFVYLPAMVVLRLKRRTIAVEEKLQLIFINLAGLFLAVGVFSAPTAARLYLVSIPGIILLCWLFQQFIKIPLISTALLIGVSLIGIAYTVQRQTTTVYHLNTPSGEVAILSPEMFSRYQWFNEHTEPNDYLYEASDPSLDMIFQLKNPTPLSWIRPNNFTTVGQVEDVIKGLRQNPPRYIVWNGAWDVSNSAQSADFHLEPLIHYMRANYHVIESFDNFQGVNGAAAVETEIWERNAVQ